MSQAHEGILKCKIYHKDLCLSSSPSSTILEGRRRDLQDEIIDISNEHKWLWHANCPILSIFNDKLPCISVNLTFGDNIEDEWFLVHALIELSSCHPDIAISITDEDGEFLVIEASEFLPNSLTPDNVINRVWLYNQHVCILPEDSDHGTVSDALRYLFRHYSSVCHEKVTQCIRARASSSLVANRFIQYRCRVSSRCAYIINTCPWLVSSAVRSFYYRDIRDSMIPSRLDTIGTHADVIIPVRFSQCLFAMLYKQEFHAPRGYNMPPENSPEYVEALMGLKLMVGFEIILRDSRTFDSDPCDRSGWHARDDKAVSALVNHLIKETPADYHPNVPEHSMENADISFLNEIPESHTKNGNVIDETDTEALGQVLDDIKKFIKHVSDYEGAELPDDDDGGDEEGIDDVEHDDLDAEFSGTSTAGMDFGENIDENLLKNLLSSLAAQGGYAGPVSSLIQMLGHDLRFGDGDDGDS